MSLEMFIFLVLGRLYLWFETFYFSSKNAFTLISYQKAYLIKHFLGAMLPLHPMMHALITFHVQETSTAKLFITPLQGLPNVLVDTPILQLVEPTQACRIRKLSGKKII